jgi:hypothetical protein
VTHFSNAMQVFKLLDQSNCRKCEMPTCLAFAAAVFQGRKALGDCPKLDGDVLERWGGPPAARTGMQSDSGTDGQNELMELKRMVAEVDLKDAARRLGGRCERGRLTLKILGKDFSVDHWGNLYSDIHIHQWVAVPFLNHVIHGRGTAPEGRWVPLRELPKGQDWYRLFEQRCEKPLKRIADTYTDLFEDMAHLFAGRQVQRHHEADISLVLRPLPKLPLLVCYWKPEDGLESSLHLFFDATAEDNLPIESVYSLGAGLVRMFEKIAQRHG